MSLYESDVLTTWQTRVHIYELDSLGHVNNANYYPYLQQATEEGWPQLAGAKLKRLSMEYLVPALHGTDLAVHTWQEAAGVPDELALGYVIERIEDQCALLRAQLIWDTAANAATAAMDAALPASVDLPRDYRVKPLRLTPEMAGGRQFCWQHRVRGYETGRDGAVSPAQVLRWTEEARAQAAEAVGWTHQRMQEADFVGVVTRHDFELMRLPRAGEEVEVFSRIYEVRRVRGTWRHELACQGEIVATAFVGGGFLNSAGLPHPPPQDLIDGLVGRS